jgi:prepilin-type N-terminal cleavage/methylation domain-containing protein
MQPSTKNGFILIELLLVVVIIGVLPAFALPQYAQTKQRGQRGAGIADLHTLLMAQERFDTSTGRYETGRYGGIADAAALRTRRSPGNGPLDITLSGAPAGSTGYAATIVIPGAETCGVYAGGAPRPLGMAADTPASTSVCW